MQRFTSRTLVVHDEGHACALKIKFFPQISEKKFFSPDFRKKNFFPDFRKKNFFQEKKFFPQISEKKFFSGKKIFPPDFRKKIFPPDFRKKIFSPDFRKHRICVQNLVKQKFLPSKGVKPFKDFAFILKFT